MRPGARNGGTLLVALALAVAPLPALARGHVSAMPRATSVDSITHALVVALKANGRAEARIERLALDPVAGGTEAARGRLVLETPDLALLEFASTGEKISLRPDGGEWLQPSLRQLVRFGPADVAGASRWWRLLLEPEAGVSWARPLGERRWLVVIPAHEDMLADSARVTLDDSGLPLRLEIEESAGVRAMYRFREWRFARPHGHDAFVVRPPHDYAVVPLH